MITLNGYLGFVGERFAAAKVKQLGQCFTSRGE
jgi:hypothetical protein